jgi:hypothetical protein
MSRNVLSIGLVLAMLFASAQMASAQGSLKSGPQPGQLIPGSFSPYNVNGKFGQKDDGKEKVPGRHHCLVCEFELKPVVLIFVRESKDDKLLMELLKQIDQTIEKNREMGGNLSSFVVFLSPYGTDAAIEAAKGSEPKTEDPKKLIELLTGRTELLGRLEQRASQLKHVVLTYFPEEGPKDYKIAPQAEFTIILYENLKVKSNFAYPMNQMTVQDNVTVMEEINAQFGKGKKKEVKDKGD